MALAKQGIEIRVNMVDKAGQSFSKTFVTDFDEDADTLATLLAYRDTIVGKYAAVTDALIKSTSINVLEAETTDTYPTNECDVADKANVVLNLDTLNKRYTYPIPCPIDALFQGTEGPSRNEVDITNAALVSLVDEFKAAGHVLVSDGENVDGTTPIIKGKRN